VQNMAQRAIGGAGGELDKAVSFGSKAMEVGGEVLDALGPVGDLLGLGMSIFGGVEGKKHAEDIKQGGIKAQAAMAQGASSIKTAGSSITTATLDTSHPAMALAASHF
jgi:hypothetical protein